MNSDERYGYRDSLSMDTGGKEEDLRAFYRREKPTVSLRVIFWGVCGSIGFLLLLWVGWCALDAAISRVP